jgi:hypothetical protein
MKRVIIAFFTLVAINATAQDSTVVVNDTTSKPNKRPIKEIKIWNDGKQYDANNIDVVSAYDDFESSATLYYKLTDSLGVVVAQGNVVISGDEYKEWASKPNHNRTGTNYVIRQLNLSEAARRRQVVASRKAVN